MKERVFIPLSIIAMTGCAFLKTADADIIDFFDSSQIATPVASGVTFDVVSSNGYQFTYTRDKLFTGGLSGGPIGRAVLVPWPLGVEAQAVTTPPAGVTDRKARITIKRVDDQVFDLTSFTAKLLASTSGAGGSIEIMPTLNGEDGFNDPLVFDATGNFSQSFSYDTSKNPLGSTALLKDFNSYEINLYVDFALTAITLESQSSVPEPGTPLALMTLVGAGLSIRRRRVDQDGNHTCLGPLTRPIDARRIPPLWAAD
ncbi:MAG: PEP-CTERM sorting domain-containing protein [Planctomycetales bacterium]|nr:PEP-CTERM sorting domain-containing protein [Planctomycetales bacterium]